MIYFLSNATIDAIRGFLQQEKEFGGALVLHSNGLVEIGKHKSGKKGDINLDVSEYSFHTHPSLCVKKNNCRLGVPSSADMESILQHHLKGMRQHMVAANEAQGIVAYVVEPTPKLVHDFHQKSVTYKSIFNFFERSQNWYADHFDQVSYDQFREKWLEDAKSMGYNVYYFPSLNQAYLQK